MVDRILKQHPNNLRHFVGNFMKNNFYSKTFSVEQYPNKITSEKCCLEVRTPIENSAQSGGLGFSMKCFEYSRNLSSSSGESPDYCYLWICKKSWKNRILTITRMNKESNKKSKIIRKSLTYCIHRVENCPATPKFSVGRTY